MSSCNEEKANDDKEFRELIVSKTEKALAKLQAKCGKSIKERDSSKKIHDRGGSARCFGIHYVEFGTKDDPSIVAKMTNLGSAQKEIFALLQVPSNP